MGTMNQKVIPKNSFTNLVLASLKFNGLKARESGMGSWLLVPDSQYLQ